MSLSAWHGRARSTGGRTRGEYGSSWWPGTRSARPACLLHGCLAIGRTHTCSVDCVSVPVPWTVIADFRVPLDLDFWSASYWVGACIPSTVQISVQGKDSVTEQTFFFWGVRNFEIWSVNYWLHSWTVQNQEEELLATLRPYVVTAGQKFEIRNLN